LGKLFTHIHVPLFTKQYNLVPVVKGRWCSAAGRVTVGLASHWPCVTDLSGLSTYRLKDLRKGDEHPAYAPVGVWHFYLIPPTSWLIVMCAVWGSRDNRERGCCKDSSQRCVWLCQQLRSLPLHSSRHSQTVWQVTLTILIEQEIGADAHEMPETLWQFLFELILIYLDPFRRTSLFCSQKSHKIIKFFFKVMEDHRCW